MLHDKLPLLLVMDVVSHIGYRYYSASAKLLYTKDINLPLKEFTLDNIQSDFGNNAELLPSLINLFKFLAKEKKYLDVYSHEEFFRCREAIGKFL